MQTFIGRLTADAQVNQLKDGRKVVNFSIATNRRYKTKDSEQAKEITTYVNCSYWLSTGVAPHLKKGAVIAATGYVGVNAWNNGEGEAKASLTHHVQAIDLLAKPPMAKTATANTTEEETDLPF